MNQFQPQASGQSKTLASFPFNWPVTSNVRLQQAMFWQEGGQRSLVGGRLWGHAESDTTEVT